MNPHYRNPSPAFYSQTNQVNYVEVEPYCVYSSNPVLCSTILDFAIPVIALLVILPVIIVSQLEKYLSGINPWLVVVGFLLIEAIALYAIFME